MVAFKKIPGKTANKNFEDISRIVWCWTFDTKKKEQITGIETAEWNSEEYTLCQCKWNSDTR